MNKWIMAQCLHSPIRPNKVLELDADRLDVWGVLLFSLHVEVFYVFYKDYMVSFGTFLTRKAC